VTKGIPTRQTSEFPTPFAQIVSSIGIRALHDFEEQPVAAQESVPQKPIAGANEEHSGWDFGDSFWFSGVGDEPFTSLL
jgi:hypothetical protein